MFKQIYYVQHSQNEAQEESQTGIAKPNERVIPRAVAGTYVYMYSYI